MRGSISSPSKHQIGVDIESLQVENQNLQFVLGERDVEMERMKTTLFALNEKINVYSDIRQDVDDCKNIIQTSVTQRNDLQAHIVQTSEKIKVDTAAHTEKHQSKTSEIRSL